MLRRRLCAHFAIVSSIAQVFATCQSRQLRHRSCARDRLFDDAIVVGAGERQAAVSEERFNNIDTRFDRVEKRLDGVAADVGVLKTDVGVLKTDVGGLKSELSDLRRHMGVLHEEVIDRIRGIGEDDSLRNEMRTGFAEIRQMFRDHTVPGEAADKHFSKTLDNHEQRIQALERRKS